VTARRCRSEALGLLGRTARWELDGVFVAGRDDALPRWVRVVAPSTEEVQQFVLVLSESIERWLDRQGFGHDDPVEEDVDDDPGATLRPPLARTRVARRPDGLWVLTLRKPYSDGTTAFIFSELELVEKLAALVPPARKNLVSYHGVLAPRHAMRSAVIPKTAATESLGLLRKEPRAKRWERAFDARCERTGFGAG
jgi:hypothetical protein